MISAIGFTTRDRPASLDRCIRSYIANCSAFGRRPRLIVMDDAVPGVHQSALPVVQGIARDHPGFEVSYAGIAEKRDFIDALTRQGLDRDPLEFALLDPEGAGYTLGANRNALMLETPGEHVLYVDDDSQACTARPPEWDDRLVIAGFGTTQRYWFYRDHAAAVHAARFEAADLLAAHELYLGKTCGDIIAAHAGEVQAWPGPWPEHMRDHAAVIVTQNGAVGDSCMFSNIGHLLHGGAPGRALQVEDPETLVLAMSSRELIRSADSPTLRMGGLLIGPDWGCDHSAPLPPFFPLYRSSDASFSALLSLTNRSWAFADIPWLVLHEAQPGRYYNQRGTAGLWRCSTGEVIRALMQTGSATGFRSYRDPVGSIGERLLLLAALPPRDFAALVRRLVDELIGMMIERLRGSLEHAAPAPVHYEAAVSRSIGFLQASLADPARFLPVELAHGRNPGETLEKLRLLLHRFACLLRAWQTIDAAACAGIRLAAAPAHAG